MAMRSSTTWPSAVLTRRATSSPSRRPVTCAEIGSWSSLNTTLSPGLTSSMWTRVGAGTLDQGQSTRAAETKGFFGERAR